jgi:hypothetical protein
MSNATKPVSKPSCDGREFDMRLFGMEIFDRDVNKPNSDGNGPYMLLSLKSSSITSNPEQDTPNHCVVGLLGQALPFNQLLLLVQ